MGGSGVCAHKPPSEPEKHTSYPRTCAGAHAVETSRDETCRVDVDTSATLEKQDKARQPVTEAEHAAAADALRQVEQTWDRAGLRPAKEPDQRAEDRALIRRAHVLVQRGLIPESVLAEAIARPVDLRRQGRVVRKPAAVLTKRLFGSEGFRELVALVRERLPRADPVETLEPVETSVARRTATPEELAQWRADAQRAIPGWKPKD